MSLGTKIRELRIAKGLTQSELGLGLVTPSMISQIESDKANPSYKVLEAIAAKLDTPLEYFLADIKTQMEEKTIHQVGQALLSSGSYLEAAELLSDLYNRDSQNVDHIRLNLDLGKAYLHLYKYDEATRHLKIALDLADQKCAQLASIDALNWLGFAEKEQNKYHSAVFYWKTAYERFEQLPEPEPFIQSQVLINLATTHQELSEFKESLHYINEAYHFLMNSDDYKQIGDTYLRLGINYKKIRDYVRASEYTQYATAIYESMKQIKLSIDAKRQYAILMGENGEFAEGIRILEECANEYTGHSYPIEVASVHGDIAELLFRQQRFEEAKRECKIALASLTNEYVETAVVLRILSKTEDALGNLDLAIQHAEKAKALFKKHGILNELVDMLSLLDGMYQKNGEPEKAMECVRNMKQLLDQILRGRGIVL